LPVLTTGMYEPAGLGGFGRETFNAASLSSIMDLAWHVCVLTLCSYMMSQEIVCGRR